MGTPKQNLKEASQLQELSARERFQAMNIGKEMDFDFTAENLTVVLEEVVKILLPLVQWLGKKITETFYCEVQEQFRNCRAIRLLSDHSSFMDIALGRSGEWIVREEKTFSFYSSAKLAEQIVKKSHVFLVRSLGHKTNLAKFIEDTVFMKKVALRNSLIWLLTEFFNSVEKQIKEREERFDIMRQRMSVFSDFRTTLDPLVIKEKPLAMPEYCIWENSGGGSRRASQDYLLPEALNSTLEIAKKDGKRECWLYETKGYISSLDNFLFRVGNIVEDIAIAEERKLTDAQSLRGWNSGRLPFTKEETVVLKKKILEIEEK